MTDREHVKLLITVARMYWEDSLSQEEIARRIGYSRSMVSRLLNEARKRGIVTVRIDHPLEHMMELENALQTTYNLTAVRVCSPAPGGLEVARMAADLVGELVTDDCVVALSNGSTISSVVRQLHGRPRPHVTAVQALGTVAQENQLIDSPEMCRMFAERLRSRYRLLPAPLVVGSTALAGALRREDSIAMSLTMASHADLVLTSVGAAQNLSSIFTGLMRPEEHGSLISSGAVGHILGHYFDSNGQHIDNDFCQRLIALPFERLEAISNVMVVSSGEEKINALRAALQGGFINTLITDTLTARALTA